jgi:low affinity Fe/Cu permease
VNELVASHERARNAVMNAEEKTEDEIVELSKEYVELAEQTKGLEEEIILNQTHKTETAGLS